MTDQSRRDLLEVVDDRSTTTSTTQEQGHDTTIDPSSVGLHCRMADAESRSDKPSPNETVWAAGTAGPNRTYVIEFVGRAGVGKTTIARRLTEVLGLPGVETEILARNRIPVTQRIQLVDLLVSIRLALALGVPVSREAIVRTVSVYKELVKLRYVRRGHGIRVFDQGLFLRLGRLSKLRPPDEKRRKAYLAVLKNSVLPDLVVRVDASPETLVQRRATECRGSTTPEEEQAIAVASTTVQDIMDLADMRGTGSIALKVVANERPDDVDAIADALAADLETSPPSPTYS